jgi:hypothetical protein
MALLANIRFAKITFRAKRLQVLYYCLPTFAPWKDMINVEINTGGYRWACTNVPDAEEEIGAHGAVFFLLQGVHDAAEHRHPAQGLEAGVVGAQYPWNSI